MIMFISHTGDRFSCSESRAILTYNYVQCHVCQFTFRVLYIQQVWVMLGASVQEYNYAWMHANFS